MLGYIFQRRWQSQGQDRSAAEEMVFIEERFGRAYAAGQAEDQLRALDAALKRLRANFRQNGGTGHIDDTVGADFTDAFASAAVMEIETPLAAANTGNSGATTTPSSWSDRMLATP